MSLLTLAAIALCVPAPLLFLVQSTRARFAAITFGALVAFNGAASVGVSKLAYAFVVVLCVAIAFPLSSERLARVGVATAGVVALLSSTAVLRGNPPLWVVRDAVTYLILCAAGPLALNFGTRLSATTIWRVAVILGLFGSYGFISEWATKRGFASLPSVGQSSQTLLAFGFGLCLVAGYRSSNGTIWYLLCIVQFLGALITGTRTMLLLLVAPAALVAFTLSADRQRANIRVRRTVRNVILAVPLAVGAGAVLAAIADIDVSTSLARIRSVTEVLASDSRGDASRVTLEGRADQQQIAWRAYAGSPVLGSGPGTQWSELRSDGGPGGGNSIDTSVAVLAKWGPIGTAMLLYYMFSWWRFFRAGEAGARWALTMYVLWPVLVLQSFLAPVIEDRGLPLVLIVAGAGLMADRLEMQPRPIPDSGNSATSSKVIRIGGGSN